jgi:hypothetical protein
MLTKDSMEGRRDSMKRDAEWAMTGAKNSLMELLGGDAAAMADILRHRGSVDETTDRLFWAWMASRISSTPVGVTCITLADASARGKDEIGRLVAAGKLLKTVAESHAIPEEIEVESDKDGESVAEEEVDELDAEVVRGESAAAVDREVRERLMEQLVCSAEQLFGGKLTRDAGRVRLYSLEDGSKAKLVVSKPHRTTGEAFIRLDPDHLKTEWLCVGTVGLDYGWIIPMARVAPFLSEIPFSKGKNSWNVLLGDVDGTDRLWVTKAKTLGIHKFRQTYGQVIGSEAAE